MIQNPNVFPYGKFKVIRKDSFLSGTCITYTNTRDEAEKIVKKLGVKWYGIEEASG